MQCRTHHSRLSSVLAPAVSWRTDSYEEAEAGEAAHNISHLAARQTCRPCLTILYLRIYFLSINLSLIYHLSVIPLLTHACLHKKCGWSKDLPIGKGLVKMLNIVNHRLHVWSRDYLDTAGSAPPSALPFLVTLVTLFLTRGLWPLWHVMWTL